MREHGLFFAHFWGNLKKLQDKNVQNAGNKNSSCKHANKLQNKKSAV